MWFAMDAKGATGTDAAALKARQEYLMNLANQRCAQGAEAVIHRGSRPSRAV
jgi:hypothetical protein